MLLHKELERLASPNNIILDLGTRDGEKMKGVAAEVVGIDFYLRPSADIEYILGNGMEMPFPDNTFDYVIGNALLEHVEDRPTLLDEVVRVLKPTGTALFSFPNRLAPTTPHGTPPWFSAVPHPIGDLIASLVMSSERASHYKSDIFNLSPVGARKLLRDRFESTEYVALDALNRHKEYYLAPDSDDLYDPSLAAEAFFKVLPLANFGVALPGGRMLFELLFPAVMYRCTAPKK